MRNWSSSSAQVHQFSERRLEILAALRRPGDHTSSSLTDCLGYRVEGHDLESIQALLMEARGGERLKRRREGRFILWWIETHH